MSAPRNCRARSGSGPFLPFAAPCARRASGLILLCALWTGALPAGATSARPVLLVLQIEDGTQQLGPVEIEHLSTYLSSSLAETGSFDIVPREELRAVLDRERAESYRACYDEACQIELGRELAAQKVLTTKVLVVGAQCVVSSTLIDLAKAASESAKTAKTACTPEGFVSAIDEIVLALSGKAPSAQTLGAKETPSGGELAVLSNPPGAVVDVDGMARGTTPLALGEEPPGSHRIRVHLEGHLPFETRAEVGEALRTSVTAELVEVAVHEAAREERSTATTWGAIFGASAVTSAIAAVTLFALAPSRESILANEYDRFLVARSADAKERLYQDLEASVDRHNLSMVGGTALTGIAVSAAVLAAVYLLGVEEPPTSTGAVTTERGTE